MAKYMYPAIFKKEETGYFIRFPDFESCYTQGDNMRDGMDMAKDVLCLTLYDMEESGAESPAASDPMSICAAEDAFMTLVECDTLEYRKIHNGKAVKKTLSIPAWLNEIAEKEKVNYSAILQQALKDHLHVEK